MSAPDRSHYSYSHYANTDVAEGFDALRFGGAIGRMLLESQERILTAALEPGPGKTIADIGTGTGRAALALARTGAAVVGIDASAEMLAVAARRASEAGLTLRWEQGDAHALPLDERSVDAAVCLRVLMHTPDWTRCLAELCRVARSRIVFDFPAAASAAAIQAGARRVAHAAGMKTEPYRVMRAGAVRRELARHGWRVRDEHRQFVLPIALHKLAGSAAFTRRVEGVLAKAGLLRLFGSPVTVVAERTQGGSER
ncbi:MAG TPA: class I SAM-dependent methyltransferase [Vicinamibacterales bacterium]|nr:class I SAM-dependent methyltransferase [Vicinamibacterales bacterium]